MSRFLGNSGVIFYFQQFVFSFNNYQVTYVQSEGMARSVILLLEMWSKFYLKE